MLLVRSFFCISGELTETNVQVQFRVIPSFKFHHLKGFYSANCPGVTQKLAQELDLLEQFFLAYTAGELPAWFYSLWLSLQAVPLYKDDKKVDVRPLGIRHSMIRLFHKEVISQNKEDLIEYLEPQQLGQSRAGAAKLVLSVRGMLEQNPSWVCVQTDVKNCFNAQSCQAVLDELLDTPSLSHLGTFAAAILMPEPALEAGGRVWGKSGTGVVQGDPSSGGFQCVGLHPSLRQLDTDCAVLFC